MKIFLRWEIDLYLNYLLEVPFDIQDVASAAFSLRSELVDITVDEFRLAYGLTPHPDAGNTPNRGASYIHATDDPQGGDSTIPQAVLDAKRAEIEAENATLLTGKLTDGQLAAKYALLWSVT